MAGRLAQSGFSVTGYDVSAARVEAAARSGVTPAKSPRDAAEGADIVLSSLPNPVAVRAAYLGGDGAVAALRAGAVLVDMSTIDPGTWREVAEAARARGAESLGAPVSGGPAEAGTGKLVFLIGGEAAVVERCRPVLDTLGSEIHHLGPLGAGHTVKLVNNVMSMCNVAVAAFTPYFSIALSRKDLSLALQMAESLGVPMLATSIVRQVYEAAAAQGLDTLDMAGVTKLYEQWAGVKVRAKHEEETK
jgi:3-hydroxyisobutyrate dehydrogenase-like beta-hydroxyacid dehydrogenase